MRFLRAFIVSMTILAGSVMAQVPAPDFDLYWHSVSPASFGLELGVHGPPASAVYLLFTFDDPFSTPTQQLTVHLLAAGVSDAAGDFDFTTPTVFLQGFLPECWLAALVLPPGGGYSLSSAIAIAGVFLPFPALPTLIPSYMMGFRYDHDADVLHLDGATGGSPQTVSLWRVPCNLVPFIGSPLDTSPASVAYLGGAVSDAGGALHLTETVAGPTPPETEVCVVATVTTTVNGSPTPIVHAVLHIKD